MKDELMYMVFDDNNQWQQWLIQFNFESPTTVRCDFCSEVWARFDGKLI